MSRRPPHLLRALDEFEAKQLLATYGVPVVAEARVEGVDAAVDAAREIGYPVVLKGCGEAFAHKTELGLVELDLRNETALREAAARLEARMQMRTGDAHPCGRLLVQRMARGQREFLAGFSRDPVYGPVVTFGLGGMLAEVLAEVALRLAPLSQADAYEMLGQTRAAALLGPVRGLPAIDTGVLVRVLLALSRLALERQDIAAVDINPLVVEGAQPLAVDALVLIDDR